MTKALGYTPEAEVNRRKVSKAVLRRGLLLAKLVAGRVRLSAGGLGEVHVVGPAEQRVVACCARCERCHLTDFDTRGSSPSPLDSESDPVPKEDSNAHLD